MRNTADRIRHALSFEVTGLLLVAPLGAWLYDMPLHDMGVVSVVSATIAMLWNYLYNLLFDHAMLRLVGHLRKTPMLRLAHAVLFEAGLLTVLMPFIAWHLGVSLMQAFVMDVSFSLFYLIFALGFNWAYDLIFPVPPPRAAPSQI
ncbi:PACE efflux transporter [Thalassovita taeanensis]|uniref:Uncharacterized membrane protein n=1 Tax=Thalassovita taeanensis TaxID=657014 RepID=A0A1H9AKV1_9RHOB|nr:PACE efflux transporter [Thalassovita taeanensis]SEP77442.1 Uncharacterized membrane protein [Thalassovita taeanensis]